jgi:multidrug efflux pump subunit AcrA (membrane-fusion protein)
MTTTTRARVLLACAALLVLAAGMAACNEETATPTPAPTSVATLGPIGASGQIVSSASVVPVRHVALAFPEGGAVAGVEVEEGDLVTVGQELARLDGAAQAATLLLAEADLRAAQAALDGALLEPGTDLAALQAAVDQASARVELASTESERTVLRAPFAGRVAAVETASSEVVAAGQEVMLLADDSSWRMETDDLTELKIAGVAVGDPATITLDALPGLVLAGVVERISPVGQTHLGDVVFTVVVKPLQDDPRLLWNMTAQVTITPAGGGTPTATATAEASATATSG